MGAVSQKLDGLPYSSSSNPFHAGGFVFAEMKKPKLEVEVEPRKPAGE